MALQKEDDVVNAKQLLIKLINHWYLFFAGLVICLSLSATYCYFAPSLWKISGKVLIDDQKETPSSKPDSDQVNASFTGKKTIKSGLANQVELLKSRSVITEAVKQMQLNVRTYLKSGLKYQEISGNGPFNIRIPSSPDIDTEQEYIVLIKNNAQYQIKNSDENINQTAAFGEEVKLPQFSVVLTKSPSFTTKGKYKIVIQPIDDAVSDLLDNYSVQISNQEATSLDVSLDYPNPKKGETVLNKIIKLYLHNNLLNKNSIADSTIRFINKRLASVNKNLGKIAKQLQHYKQENDIKDLSEKSKNLVAEAKDYSNKLIAVEKQLAVAENIRAHLNKSGKNQPIPDSLTINDTTLEKVVDTYNALLTKREKIKSSSDLDSAALRKIDFQADTVFNTLLKTVASYRKNLLSTQNELNKQNASFTGKIKQVPAKERTYLNYVHQQNVQQELSLFLIKKREEIAISKTSSVAGARVIDYAKSEAQPFSPQKPVIYVFGLILGMILPAIYLFMKELFNIRINTKADVQKLTSIPVIGEINHNEEGKTLVLDKNFDTPIAKGFKKLGENLPYIVTNHQSNVLLFTSSMSGEGKSFLSLNLGYALALSGKKVVFVELDLRKPKLSENIGIDNSFGYTNYAISDTVTADDIIKPLWFHKNCFLISSGEIPPNPEELLTNVRLEKLIGQLKKRFDFVIIDCSPVGKVADTLLIEKLADAVFYVVRQEYTYKSQLGIVNDLKESNQIKKLYLIINDVELKDKTRRYFGIKDNSKLKKGIKIGILRSGIDKD